MNADEFDDPDRIAYDAVAEAEQCVIGSALLRPDGIDEAIGIGLRADDFAATRHQALWEAIADMAARGVRVDATSLAGALMQAGTLAAHGGPLYLHTLTSAPPAPMSIAAYARTVIDAANVRRLHQAALRVAAAADTAGVAVADRIDRAVSIVLSVQERASAPDTQGGIAEAVQGALEAMCDDTTGTPTGIGALDDRLNGGLYPGSLTILAARPGLGKTAVALQAAINVVKRGGHVVYVTLEMTPADLATRALANISGVDYGRILGHASTPLDPDALAKVDDAARKLRASGLVIPAGATRTAESVRAQLRQAHRRRPVDLVIVDYLQLLTASDERVNRQEQVSRQVRTTKLSALDTGVPHLVLSQLNRQGEREGRKPSLTDLRESGSIEQDADNVILLWRNLDDGGDPTEMIASVAKHRRGPIGPVKLSFDGARQRVTDRAWTPHGVAA